MDQVATLQLLERTVDEPIETRIEHVEHEEPAGSELPSDPRQGATLVGDVGQRHEHAEGREHEPEPPPQPQVGHVALDEAEPSTDVGRQRPSFPFRDREHRR